MTMLGPGSWIDFPAALRLACQIFFMAKPPSWIASDDPVVAVPFQESSRKVEELPSYYNFSPA